MISSPHFEQDWTTMLKTLTHPKRGSGNLAWHQFAELPKPHFGLVNRRFSAYLPKVAQNGTHWVIDLESLKVFYPLSFFFFSSHTDPCICDYNISALYCLTRVVSIVNTRSILNQTNKHRPIKQWNKKLVPSLRGTECDTSSAQGRL